MDVATSAHIDQLPLTMGQALSDGMTRIMPEQLRFIKELAIPFSNLYCQRQTGHDFIVLPVVRF